MVSLISRSNNKLTNNAFIMSQWYMCLPMLYEQCIVGEKSVSPAVAKKYTFDFNGLLKNEFDVRDEFLYPHLLVNNLVTPTEYDGEKLTIRLLDVSKLMSYYNNFNQ